MGREFQECYSHLLQHPVNHQVIRPGTNDCGEFEYIGTVFREEMAIATQPLLQTQSEHHGFLNILVYLDGRRVANLTGSCILNVAILDLEADLIHYSAIGTFKDKAVEIRENYGDVLLQLQEFGTR